MNKEKIKQFREMLSDSNSDPAIVGDICIESFPNALDEIEKLRAELDIAIEALENSECISLVIPPLYKKEHKEVCKRCLFLIKIRNNKGK